jgi:nitrite reductase (NADH) small subunit
LLKVQFAPVAKVGSIAEGQGATFTVGDRLIALFFIGGEYYAIDDLCPHMGASLGAGYVHDQTVVCPWHAWRFRLSDGTWCDNPRVKIGSYPVRIVGDEIQVGLEPQPGSPEPLQQVQQPQPQPPQQQQQASQLPPSQRQPQSPPPPPPRSQQQQN